MNWKLFCTDKFGRSNDCYVVEEGNLILVGLRKLWFCELESGRYENGSQSFMYYRLVVAGERSSFAVEIGDQNKPALSKLINWSKDEKDTVVNLVSKVHFDLIKMETVDKSEIVSEILKRVESIDSFILFQKEFREYPASFTE